MPLISGGVERGVALAIVTAAKPLILFVCSAKLWLWLTLRNHHSHSNRSCHDDDIDDDDDDDDIGALVQSSRPYNHHHDDSILFRRDTSLDFHPNNNNWTHFETHHDYNSNNNNNNKNENEPQQHRESLSSMDSYTDNLLRGKECHGSNSSSAARGSSPHSNAQRCLPSKLILIRHGQSEGNVDESLYATKPDNAMGLTKLGWEMARMAGRALRGDEEKEGLIPPGESVHFIVSPYARTVETFHGIASAWIDPEEIDFDEEEGEEEEEVADNSSSISAKRSKSRHSNIINDYNGSYHNTNNCSSAFSNTDHSSDSNNNSNGNSNYNHRRCKRLKAWYKQLMKMGLTWHEDPRIREQDFGNYQDPKVIKKCKAERHKFGTFYYRYPHGESASDVFDRVSTFLDSLWRSFESGRAQNYVIVAHGVSIRVFLARYFRYSIDQFHMLANPKNCEIIVLGHDGMGRLKLDGRCELELSKHFVGDENNESEEEKMRRNDETKGQTLNSSHAEITTTTGITTTVVTGYKKHSRLRTIPPQWLYPRTVRMCYNDA